MKLITLVLGLCLSAGSFAGQKTKIAFLTSIDPSDGKRFYHSQTYNNNEKFEKEFRSQFRNGDYEIIVKHFASIEDIWNVLHDETISGVYFLSHSGGSVSSSSGAMKAPALIADYEGNDLKNAFQRVHANLRYLAVVGCESESIIEEFKKNKTYANAPQLVIKTFPEKIRPMKGLRDAVSAGISALATTSQVVTVRPDLPRNFLVREIPRDVDEGTVRATLVLMQNKVIGFFPKGKPGEIQRIGIDETLKHRTSIVHDSGLSSSHKKQEIALGELKLEDLGDDCEINAERNKNGEILGIGKHFYRLNCL